MKYNRVHAFQFSNFTLACYLRIYCAALAEIKIRNVCRIFSKEFPLRCGCISAHFKEPEMALIFVKGARAFLVDARPENF